MAAPAPAATGIRSLVSRTLIITRKEPDWLKDCPRINERLPGRKQVTGCSRWFREGVDSPDATCEIWIASDDVLARNTVSYVDILRHEIGHCNGWLHDENGVTLNGSKAPPPIDYWSQHDRENQRRFDEWLKDRAERRKQ
jgi:hypothetical protein